MWGKNSLPISCIFPPLAASSVVAVAACAKCLIFSYQLSVFVYSGVDGFSVDITIAVDIRDQNNKELSMRLVTDIQSGDIFYTDLNGFQVGSRADSAIQCKTMEQQLTVKSNTS